MSQHRVARRYALALMESGAKAANLEAISDDLRMMRELHRQSRDFSAFLKNPVVKREKKAEILAEMFNGKIQPLTSELLRLLAEKGRAEFLPGIIDTFFLLQDIRDGIVVVSVRSAVGLSDLQTAQLKKRFEGLTKKKVRLSLRIDAELKGGFVARVGDTVFDGSIVRQLELLRKRITEGTTRP